MPLSAEMPAPVNTTRDVAAAIHARACSNSAIVPSLLQARERPAHARQSLGRIRPVDADDGAAVRPRPPAIEHPRNREAGEDANQRDSGSRGYVLAGGVVADVQAAGRDDGGKAREGAVPERGAHSGTLDGLFHARGLFSARAFVDADDGAVLAEQTEQTFFEGIGQALGRILAHAQADGNRGSVL